MELIKGFVNYISNPTMSFTLAIIGFAAALYFKQVWSRTAGLVALIGGVLYFILSIFDENFWLIVAKPDNVPITGMIFIVGFFVWYSMNQAVENDKRISDGEKPIEKQEEEKVWVWPDLVYTELICLVLVTIVLIVWSIFLLAPIEQAANPADSPNPSKAPWYFLGLQEMLVYFDPWLAGVVFPTFIIVGLMAIPFIDTNPKGNGYYTWSERKAEIAIFLFGFLVLWVLLVISGTFLRGPNWNFFGPYEYWDIHRVEPLLNVHISDFFWVKFLNRPTPSAPLDAGFLTKLLYIFFREWLGILLVGFYTFVLPVILAKPMDKAPGWIRWMSLNKYYVKMGAVRYYTGVFLFLFMMMLPIKMYLRWAFNLKYFISIPEYFFNI